jgi:hypothetical protein
MQSLSSFDSASMVEFVKTPVGMAVLGGAALVLGLAFCRIFAKAGFRPATGLLMLVPGVNVVMILVLAFLPWPIRREARHLRKIEKVVHRSDKQRAKAA